MNPFYVLEHANLYCGAAPSAEQASNHLVLVSVKLPTLEMQFVDHRAGGAPVATEIDMIQTRLECEFELLGIQPQVMTLMGRHQYGGNNLETDALVRAGIGGNDYHIFGHVRNYATGEALQAVAHLRGQLGRVEMQPYRNGAAPMTTRYSIRSIVKYKFELAGQPIFEWDFFQNLWAISGFDQNGNSTTFIGAPPPPSIRPPSLLEPPPENAPPNEPITPIDPAFIGV